MDVSITLSAHKCIAILSVCMDKVQIRIYTEESAERNYTAQVKTRVLGADFLR